MDRTIAQLLAHLRANDASDVTIDLTPVARWAKEHPPAAGVSMIFEPRVRTTIASAGEVNDLVTESEADLLRASGADDRR